MKVDVEPATFGFACPKCGCWIERLDPVVWSKADAEQRIWPMCWSCWKGEWQAAHESSQPVPRSHDG